MRQKKLWYLLPQEIDGFLMTNTSGKGDKPRPVDPRGWDKSMFWVNIDKKKKGEK